MKNYRELLFVVVLGASCGAYAADGAGASDGEAVGDNLMASKKNKLTSPRKRAELVLSYVKNTISSWTGGRFDPENPEEEMLIAGHPISHDGSPTRDKDAQALKKLTRTAVATETTRLLQAPAR